MTVHDTPIQGMDPTLEHVIRRLHETPTQAVIYVTGGATQSLPWLQCIPGSSNTLLECTIPYSRSAFLSTIGPSVNAPSSFTSRHAARLLARAAYHRAVALASPGVRVVGVAAACTLATAKVHRSPCRAFVATHAADCAVDYDLTLSSRTTRQEQDTLASRLVVQALADIAGVDTMINKPAHDQNREKTTLDKSNMEQSETKSFNLKIDPIKHSGESALRLVRHALRDGDLLAPPLISVAPSPPVAVARSDAAFAERVRSRWNIGAGRARLILPGSFNPLHEGHRMLLSLAQKLRSDLEPAFELCITNVDKPSLSEKEILHRVEQFTSDEGIIISKAGLFSDKVRLFPQTCFIVGADTAVRIVNPKYYNGNVGLVRALADMRAHGASFLVAGRVEQRKDGTKSEAFQSMEDVLVPIGFEDMFEAIPESEFRMDVSSSEIRKKQQQDG